MLAEVAVAPKVITAVVVAVEAAAEVHLTAPAEERVAEATAEAEPCEQPHTGSARCGYDAHHRIDEIRRKKATEASDSDGFPAYSSRLRDLLLPEKSEPLGITKYDTK
jgi:hypothetical protein